MYFKLNNMYDFCIYFKQINFDFIYISLNKYFIFMFIIININVIYIRALVISMQIKNLLTNLMHKLFFSNF
jgi:hypothetical protein